MAWGFRDLQGHFRRRRNRRLGVLIDAIAARTGRPVKVLDIGGRAEFWDTVESPSIEKITITNIAEVDFTSRTDRFTVEGCYADALDLSAFRTEGYDLVVCNSVIEHLYSWKNIRICAGELASVAPNGFVQTPSFWFPMEQHFMIPFFHWLPYQMRVILLPYLPRRGYQETGSIDVVRDYIEEINLLTGREFASLFPAARIFRERVAGLTKSYIAVWEAASPRT